MKFTLKCCQYHACRTDVIKLFAFVLLTQLSFLSRSQNYIPLAVEGAQWVVAFNHIDTPWLVDDLWEYYAEGDTNINGKTYKKIYFRQLVVTQDPPPFEPDGEYELKGFIRDDSTERKVFAIDMDPWGNDFCPANEEFLMFDFSVITGDTVDFCLIPYFYTWTIDTIYPGTFIGFETRYYEFLYCYEGYYEGMGSTYGLFEPMFTPFKKSDQKYIFYTYLYYYCREFPCDLIVSVPEITSVENHLRIFPNPARDIVNINLRSSVTDGKIRLFNIYGQELIKVQINKGDVEYSLDLSGLTSGIYILTLTQAGVVLDREKILVAN
ncbi:MAG: T9SS type A sorting domain-containing protein [Bacteroidales bacterium]|nr:T9SS type A sorting domain-containing protein [Bacteroidales bacterium]